MRRKREALWGLFCKKEEKKQFFREICRFLLKKECKGFRIKLRLCQTGVVCFLERQKCSTRKEDQL